MWLYNWHLMFLILLAIIEQTAFIQGDFQLLQECEFLLLDKNDITFAKLSRVYYHILVLNHNFPSITLIILSNRSWSLAKNHLRYHSFLSNIIIIITNVTQTIIKGFSFYQSLKNMPLLNVILWICVFLNYFLNLFVWSFCGSNGYQPLGNTYIDPKETSRWIWYTSFEYLLTIYFADLLLLMMRAFNDKSRISIIMCDF